METKYIADIAVVKKFIKQISRITSDKSFNPNTQFYILKRKNDISQSLYTNTNTMLMFGYTSSDVLNEIKQLTANDYCESIIDLVSNNINLHVFKKKIQGENVYIKITVKNENKIICISFHISNE